jgi:Ca2+-binding EF-hand superfamily protein
MLPPP